MKLLASPERKEKHVAATGLFCFDCSSILSAMWRDRSGGTTRRIHDLSPFSLNLMRFPRKFLDVFKRFVEMSTKLVEISTKCYKFLEISTNLLENM